MAADNHRISPLNFVKALPRILAAFLLAPGIGVVVACALTTGLLLHAFDWSLIAEAMPIAYLVAGVVGIPAFLMSRAWLPIPLRAYAIVGSAAASFVAFPLTIFFGVFAWGLIILVAGAISGISFGLILGSHFNRRAERP